MSTGVPNQHTAVGIPEGTGSVWDTEGQILAEFARAHGGPVLEIGTQRGLSTRYILRGLDAGGWGPEHLVYAVDLFHQHRLADSEPRLRCVSCNSQFYQGPPVAWAFIDGLHTYEGVCHDLQTALAHGARTILLHDYHERLQGQPTDEGVIGVKRAVDDWLVAHPDWTFTRHQTDGGLVELTKT